MIRLIGPKYEIIANIYLLINEHYIENIQMFGFFYHSEYFIVQCQCLIENVEFSKFVVFIELLNVRQNIINICI